MEQTFEIKNRLGLHARAAAQLVQLLGRFESETFISRDGQTVNGKSIMGVLTLAAAQGCEIHVRIEGPDAGAAMEAVAGLVNNKFGEE
jgi:phosphocarrier protein HPr